MDAGEPPAIHHPQSSTLAGLIVRFSGFIGKRSVQIDPSDLRSCRRAAGSRVVCALSVARTAADRTSWHARETRHDEP